MNGLVVFTVVDIVLLIAGLALYLFIVGSGLKRVATGLEDCRELVNQIKANAEPIEANLEHVNATGRVIAGALPLLYGMAEGIVVGATFDAEVAHAERGPALPASGTRRSRLLEGVGYHPE